MAKPESPSEPFKRAVTVAVRSLAAEPELEVNFSSEPPSLKGLKARLPSPHRNLSAQDIALVRGTGDAYALRKAYHDEKINNQLLPWIPDVQPTSLLLLSSNLTGAVASFAYMFAPWANSLGGKG